MPIANDNTSHNIASTLHKSMLAIALCIFARHESNAYSIKFFFT